MAVIPGQSVTVELQHVLHDGVRQARQQDRAVLVSIADRAWPGLDAIDLFDRAGQMDRFFWSQPGEGFTLVGLGIAQAIVAVEGSRFRQTATSWRHMLAGAILEGPRGLPGVGPLLCGGFRFDVVRPAITGAEAALWDSYPDGCMVLPEFMVTASGDETWFTYNVMVAPDADADALAGSLAARWDDLLASSFTIRTAPEHEQITLRELRRSADWQDEVARTADDIAQGKLEKAVLARAVRLEAPEPFDVATALRRLSESYRDCFVFAVGEGDHCFVGATPERLARVRDGLVSTMSVAGTIRRGATPEEDKTLGDYLLGSVKDNVEHAPVVRAIVEALGDLCEDLDVGKSPSLIKLGNLQHLYTPVSGRLLGEHTLLDVIERLHPTPAVGGWPLDIALRIIREREGFDRGWYAGPVGWMDQNGDGDFAVALRSALLHGSQATLFAGCGIVADSNPEREYAESCLKLKPMLSALNAE